MAHEISICPMCDQPGVLVCGQCHLVAVCGQVCWKKFYLNHRRFCTYTISEVCQILRHASHYSHFSRFLQFYRLINISRKDLLTKEGVVLRVSHDAFKAYVDSHKLAWEPSDFPQDMDTGINRLRTMFISFFITHSNDRVRLRDLHSVMTNLLRNVELSHRCNVFDNGQVISTPHHLKEVLFLDYHNTVILVEIFSGTRSVDVFLLFQTGGHGALIRANGYFTFIETYLDRVADFLIKIGTTGHHATAFKKTIKFSNLGSRPTRYQYRFHLLDIDYLNYVS
jgi:hypothetical protein